MARPLKVTEVDVENAIAQLRESGRRINYANVSRVLGRSPLWLAAKGPSKFKDLVLSAKATAQIEQVVPVGDDDDSSEIPDYYMCSRCLIHRPDHALKVVGLWASTKTPIYICTHCEK